MQQLAPTQTSAAALTDSELRARFNTTSGVASSEEMDPLLKREQFAVSLRKIKRQQTIDLRRKKTCAALTQNMLVIPQNDSRVNSNQLLSA